MIKDSAGREMNEQNCDYDAPNVWIAFRRVLCAPKLHYERANVFTHLVAALVTGGVILSMEYIPYFSKDAADTSLSRAAAWTACGTFFISSMFHVLRTVDPDKVPYVSTLAHVADYACVFASLSMSAVANASVWSGPKRDWRTISDPAFAGGACVLFVAARNLLHEQKRWTFEYKTLKVCRRVQYDGLHTATASAAGLCVFSSAFLATPALFAYSPDYAATAAIGLACATSSLFALGRALEAGAGEVALELAEHDSRVVRKVVMCMRSRGAVCGSHATWHVLSALAVVLDLLQREIVLAERAAAGNGQT